MLTEIIARAPTWVFVLFFVLLGLGYLQSRPRVLRRSGVLALPTSMGLFSLYGLASGFGLSALAWTSWVAGVVLALKLGARAEQPKGVRYSPEMRTFAVPGSWVPLGLMMAIFFTKFAIGTALAIQPALVERNIFIAAVNLAYGGFAGIFVARARIILRDQLAEAATGKFTPSQRQMLALTLVALAVLDLGRSLNAHYGYDQPASIWHPDPMQYASITWPPGSDTPPAASPAQRLYLRNCAVCHGPDGRGNGPAAPSMIPRPRDFTQGEYKYKTTPAGTPPSDADLTTVVRDGLHASGMPYFRDVLTADEIGQLVGYIKQFSSTFGKTAAPLTVLPRPAVTAKSLVRGGELYRTQGCITCHGETLRGGMELKDAKSYPVVSRDLTAPWTFRGGDSPQQVFLRLSTGMAPSPMPAYAELSETNRWDLVAFIESRRRLAPWEPGGKLEGPAREPGLEARGRHLVHSAMCGLCHTEVDPHGIYRDDRYLAGGMRVGAHPQGIFVSPNLTPDKDTGLGNWSEQEIADAIRNGRARNGRLLNFWGMPWMYLHQLSAEDAAAIARYLKTLPAIHNEVPATLHYGVVETLFAKIRNGGVFLGRAPVLTYAIGSYANLGGLRPDRVQAGLVTAQWVVLVLAAMLLTSYGLHRPSGMRGWLKAFGMILCGLLVAGGTYFLNNSPTLGFLPPDKVAAGATASIHRPQLVAMLREKAALVERGGYVFATASCAYCHGNDGAGGFKLSGSHGSIFTPNISPHPVAGIGAWSDSQIARAIRTGVSRSGRPLYWQGMPWDHYSNLDEEDVVALVSYLRVMPPIDLPMPPYQPPTPDDCKEYTFWTSRNTVPGCR